MGGLLGGALARALYERNGMRVGKPPSLKGFRLSIDFARLAGVHLNAIIRSSGGGVGDERRLRPCLRR